MAERGARSERRPGGERGRAPPQLRAATGRPGLGSPEGRWEGRGAGRAREPGHWAPRGGGASGRGRGRRARAGRGGLGGADRGPPGAAVRTGGAAGGARVRDPPQPTPEERGAAAPPEEALDPQGDFTLETTDAGYAFPRGSHPRGPVPLGVRTPPTAQRDLRAAVAPRTAAPTLAASWPLPSLPCGHGSQEHRLTWRSFAWNLLHLL